MAIAGIGFATGLAEDLATAIAAGMVIGGFMAGSIGTFRGWERAKLDRNVLALGYVGGSFAVMLVPIDLILRYGG